jgi:hypothetical protein
MAIREPRRRGSRSAVKTAMGMDLLVCSVLSSNSSSPRLRVSASPLLLQSHASQKQPPLPTPTMDYFCGCPPLFLSFPNWLNANTRSFPAAPQDDVWDWRTLYNIDTIAIGGWLGGGCGSGSWPICVVSFLLLPILVSLAMISIESVLTTILPPSVSLSLSICHPFPFAISFGPGVHCTGTGPIGAFPLFSSNVPHLPATNTRVQSAGRSYARFQFLIE